MYIDPFVAGIPATVGTEMFLIIAWAIINTLRK